jgi:hypothetical protein
MVAAGGYVQRLTRWIELRNAPFTATMAMLLLVMAFSLLGHTVLHGGQNGLLAPGDLWSLAQSSSALLHGDFARIYVHDGALTSPPAFEIALAPVIGLGQFVGLSPHLHHAGEPLSMWFVLGPAAVLAGATVLFAVDAVARTWLLPDRSRMAIALVGALGVATVVGGWGHPEDCIALAFVIWAALAMERSGTAGAPRAALLLGMAVAFQPLAILGVAPVLARLPLRDLARLWWRLLLPSLIVLLPPLVAETHQTLFVLVHQPFLPAANSRTPLTPLAPHIGPGLDGGGPTRLAATLLSVGLAFAVCRRRHDLATVLTLTAVAFYVRILFETELNWYYVWPVPALCLLLAMRRSWLRFWVCTTALLASIVLTPHAARSPLPWWPAVMATVTLMLLSAVPLGQFSIRLGSRRRVATAGTMSAP